MSAQMEASANSTILSRRYDRKLISAYSFKIFEGCLKASAFRRINRTLLVNKSLSAEEYNVDYFQLKNKEEILIPRRRKTEL
ncbi:MAG: hypothetical protein ACI8UX_000646 [Psychromonas sp.]|jgi:hypothetical protein